MTFEDHKKSVDEQRDLQDRESRILMCREINAYLEGARQAGADSINIAYLRDWIEKRMAEL